MEAFVIEKSFFPFLKIAGRFIVAFLAFSVFLSCHNTNGLSVSAVPDGEGALNRLAFIPFREILPKDPSVKAVSCPLCAAVFITEKFPQVSTAVVEDIFYEHLYGYGKLNLVAPENAGEVYRRVSASLDKATLLEILKKTGVELGVDGVLVGYVYRFRERQGYPYSVKKPASVAFDIHLVRVSDGRIVWRASFDKTQTSLMENLFQLSSFFKLGGKWATAAELATEGVKEMLKTFPGI